MIRAAVFGLVLASAQVATAENLSASLRPVLRNADVSGQSVAAPQSAQGINQKEAKSGGGLFSSLRPLFRTKKVVREGRVKRQMLAKGALCGDVAIQGEKVGRVTGKKRGCLIEDAVRVRSVSGVSLSQRSVMDCQTADALKTWLDGSAKPALSKKGGGLRSIRVAAHYACRTRNNKKGAKLSEHGKGRAIDISAFRLADGTEVTVLKGWKAKRFSQAMRRMHKGACGPFGTVLGPNANRFHLDHFHFDTARYRSGSYCK